jgi:hypothetical protein
MAKLTGEALLAYVQAHGNSVPENELAIATGYCTKKRDSDVVIAHKQQLFRALLAAKGLGTFVTQAPVGTPRSKPSGSLLAGGRGLVSLTAAYTRQIDVTPGDRVTIQVITDEDVVRVSGPALVIHKMETQVPFDEPEDEEPEEEDEPEILGAVDPARLTLVA